MTVSKGFSEKDFEKLFKEHYPFLCSFAKKYVNDTDACKDIIHNVFLNLWQKSDTLDLSTSLKPYLFKAVHNRCLNYLRDQKKMVRHDLITDSSEIPDYIESPAYLEQSELEQKVKAAIDSLPEKCREIFILSRFEGKKYSEIAERQQVSVKAIEAQMSKALKLLREQLIEYLVFLIFLSVLILGL